MQLQDLVEKTVAAIGYELVDLERIGRGLLRVYIDFPQGDDLGRSGITLYDCEKVSHQLTHVLMVEDVDYDRLEVSSPGLDRRLRKSSDFMRFSGCEIALKLRRPVAEFSSRKSFQGILNANADGGLQLDFDGQDGEKKVLTFVLADVDKARLVPKMDFGGRKA